MRQGSAILSALLVLGAYAPASFGQYYGPPMGPAYPPPGNMMPYRPQMYYPPQYYQPQMMYPPQQVRPMQMAQPAPRVYNFGPLNETIVPANEVPAKPLPRADIATPIPIPAAQGQAPAKQVSSGYRSLPIVTGSDIVPEACGPGCSDGACGPVGCGPVGCGPVTQMVPTRGKHGHGHFIGEIGAYFLVPYLASRNAYTDATTGASTEFPQTLGYGARASLGYIFHNTWGGRFNYAYVNAVSNVNATVLPGGATINTAGPGPLAIASTGGTDVYNFRQRVELHVGEFEIVKEAHCFDTTLLFGSGIRYANLQQSYRAIQSNGALPFQPTQAELNVRNVFQGWGPTVSFEAIHPVCWGIALYGNTRGSFLWGSETVNQTLTTALATTTASANSTPFVPIGEVELGVQYGCRIGRSYVFTRIGGVASRWWNVGSPNTTTGNLSFLGGTAMLGITY